MRPLTTNPEHREKERAFVRAVNKRDGWRCHLERRWPWGWEKCDCRATDTAHIHSRSREPAVKYDPRNGIKACRKCHLAYDKHEEGVRVPPERKEQADIAVLERSKLHV